mmetsp:Transcript_65681/g.103330  ORF Transcript_65681/g.103330 Transcript_65681/m.103330 type:complete len:84 (+) Transcript_65681:1066-1317(+)
MGTDACGSENAGVTTIGVVPAFGIKGATAFASAAGKASGEGGCSLWASGNGDAVQCVPEAAEVKVSLLWTMGGGGCTGIWRCR